MVVVNDKPSLAIPFLTCWWLRVAPPDKCNAQRR